MPLSGTARGGGVDDTASRATKLGAITTGLDLILLVHVERHVTEAQASAEVGDVEAVDVIGVFAHGGTAERGQVAERGVALGGSGRKQSHGGYVARHGQAVEGFFGHDRGRLDRSDVDRRRSEEHTAELQSTMRNSYDCYYR